MSVEWIRKHCLSLPHTTEQVQWGNDLVFKIGGKMYAVAVLEPGPYCMSLKCAPEKFAELVETPGIAPAPYLARAHWVALEEADVLPAAELKSLLRQAYELVLAKLPRKTQAALASKKPSAAKRRSR
jgi:predicted DNA-binding protein (MmcQ/YjbR family)